MKNMREIRVMLGLHYNPSILEVLYLVRQMYRRLKLEKTFQVHSRNVFVSLSQ